MIESRNFVPEYYRNSRDYDVFLKLLDLVTNDTLTKTNNLQDLFNPDKCPNELLQLLSTFCGYDYDYLEDYKLNRTIIKYFTKLLRNRGSKIGILMAVAIANITNSDSDNLELNKYSNIELTDETINGVDYKILNIYVYNREYLSKMQYLLERVRPAGVMMRIVPTKLITEKSQVQMHTYLEAESNTFGYSNYGIGDNEITSSEIIAETPTLPPTPEPPHPPVQ